MRLVYGNEDQPVQHFASLVLESDAGALAWAYFDATEALIRAGISRELLPNLVAFPVLYMLRQSAELQLKAILSEAKSLGDEVPEVEKSHGLSELWAAVRAYLLERWPGQEDYLPGLTLDEIRIATTFNEALGVPEPSTLVLAVFGLLGLMGIRRRGRK